VIASGCKRVRQFAEDTLGIVVDFAGLAVEELRSAHHFAAKCRANCLVSQADAKNREFAREPANQLNADAGVLRRAGTRRNHNALRLAARNFLHGNFVVAVDFNVATQLAEILRQVIGKRIVVVD
jgi:hypothetical protein